MGAEISIFFDTNILQSFGIGGGRNNSSDVHLGKLGIPDEFYKFIDFIDDFNLKSQVEICIPEVVVMEMKHHMQNGFCQQIVLLQKDFKLHRNVFGDVVQLEDAEIKYNPNEYKEYVNTLFNEFFDRQKEHVKMIPFPRQNSIIEKLIDKAISGVSPFFSGKIGRKRHSDAGFKDALIAETIYEYQSENNTICLFVTEDGDFCNIFSNKIKADSKLVIFSSIDSVVEALKEHYHADVDIKTKITKTFLEDIYRKERLLNEANLKLDESITESKVIDVKECDGKNVFIIKVLFVVNEVEYTFIVKFDNGANEFLDIKTTTEND